MPLRSQDLPWYDKREKMKLHFLFPASPLNGRMIDEAFQDQAIALKMAGFETSVLTDDMKIIGPLSKIDGDPDVRVVYRGWMMDAEGYQNYLDKLAARPATPLTSMEQYLATHYLPNWYPLLEKWTPSTSIFPLGSELLKRDKGEIGYILGEHVRTMRGLHHLSGYGDGSEWTKFQLKDYVKSLKTDGGSALTNTEDITPTLEKMEKYRGTIEGGICLRAWEEFIPDSERRYFVINNRYFSQEGSFDLRAMRILARVHDLVPSPFYSVDIAQPKDSDTEFRLVEIGDGQVSDLVGWTPQRFAEIWKESNV
jgi:ATP-grasp domain, R2K clade family 3